MPFYYVIVPTGNCLTWRDCFFVIFVAAQIFSNLYVICLIQTRDATAEFWWKIWAACKI